jgi:hypothetical protein
LRTEVKEDIKKLEESIDSNFKWTIVIIIGGFIATIANSIILRLLLG